MSETVSEFNNVLPETIDGWKKSEPPDLYTPENLSTYIDGGAELYISFNFKNALSVKYKDSADNEIAVDIFDMATSYDAFGVFAHSRETIETEVGQGSEYASGLLTFWKDRYYVSILAYPETAAKKDIVFKLGRAIAGAIKNEGPLPPILALLPTENLLPETVHYFHHYIWLNSFYFVSNENVLDIEERHARGPGQIPAGGLDLFPAPCPLPGCGPGRSRSRPIPAKSARRRGGRDAPAEGGPLDRTPVPGRSGQRRFQRSGYGDRPGCFG